MPNVPDPSWYGRPDRDAYYPDPEPRCAGCDEPLEDLEAPVGTFCEFCKQDMED